MGDHLRSMMIDKLAAFDTMAVATADKEGNVDCASVYFAYDSEGCLYFATAATSQKAQHLAKNGRISASMDDRKQSGIQIRGRAVKLSGPEAAQAKKRLLDRHAKIARWFENPHVEFFRLVPEACFVINFAWGSDWRVPVAL